MTTYEPADWRPEPGELAAVSNAARTDATAMLDDYGRWKLVRPGVMGSLVVQPTRVRRLMVVDPASTVVLDPDNPDDVEKFSAAAVNHDGGDPAEDALRSLLPAVTPPEPNGEFAVVVDQSHRAWHRRHNGMWSAAGEQERPWSLIGLGAIQYHGVGCSCGAPDCNGGAS